MSRPSSPALPDSAGLPSYEHSVQEKRARHSTRIVDEDGFLVYDAAVFDAVADSYNPPSSSSRTPKRDLKLALHSLKSSRPPTRPSRLVIVDGPADEADDSDEQESPPPPFTPTAPSADRSPFGQVAYPPHNGPDSRPSSPLASPPLPTSRHTHNFSPQAPQSFHTSPRPPHHTFPSIAYPSGPSAIARSSPPTAPRNVSSAMTSRMSFDPSVAYAKPHASQGSPTSVSGGASAFYNAAVTPHLPARSPPTYPNAAL
ncbi:hypothetical protein OF83DRAFT_1102910 [Amylostereum chailletii]|nr:hypothetical protein OF83DRAFT_1102910 [Amylostereum chailletii]